LDDRDAPWMTIYAYDSGLICRKRVLNPNHIHKRVIWTIQNIYGFGTRPYIRTEEKCLKHVLVPGLV
jgi:hypothetical protein